MSNSKIALLAGATGLVGKQLLPRLLQCTDYKKVYVLSRRLLDTQHYKLKVIVSDFSNLERELPNVQMDDIYCCLGTTLKDAGSSEEFRRVDYDLCLQLAEAGLQRQARHFLLISASGANHRSPLLYQRIKGELEEKLKTLSYPALSIFRPALLDGERDNKRFGEELALWVMRPLGLVTSLLIPRYVPVKDSDAADAMLYTAQNSQEGLSKIESEEIRRIARNYKKQGQKL